MGPTPFPLPQASGCTLTAHSGQNTGKEKKREKNKWKNITCTLGGLYRSIHTLRGTLHQGMWQWQSVEVHRTKSSSLSSFLTEFKIPGSLPLCLFIQYPAATKYPPEMVKRSHWPFLPPRHMERTPCAATTFTLARCKPPHHLFCRRVLWVITPRSPPSLPVFTKLQISYGNKANESRRKFTGQYTTAKSSVKLLAWPKMKALGGWRT